MFLVANSTRPSVFFICQLATNITIHCISHGHTIVIEHIRDSILVESLYHTT